MLHQSESTKNFQTPFFSDKKQTFSIVDIDYLGQTFYKNLNLQNKKTYQSRNVVWEQNSDLKLIVELFIWSDSVWTGGSWIMLYWIQCEQVALVACYMGFSVNRWLL